MGRSPQKRDVTTLGCYTKAQAHYQYCARRALEAEGGFQDQKGRLQEALGRCVLFSPNFNCELNFIQHEWCQAKWLTRESYGYDFEALKATVPEALLVGSVSNLRLLLVGAHGLGFPLSAS